MMLVSKIKLGLPRGGVVANENLVTAPSPSPNLDFPILNWTND